VVNKKKSAGVKKINWGTVLILGAIIILAGWWRLDRLGELPYGLNRDEAAIGYNALLLKETGRDEWQRLYPVTLESFGDYKLPAYPYITAGLFHFLPITDLTVRLPSSVAGVGLVVVTWGLGMVIWRNKKVALLLAALVASNPIFIWYARGAWEANVGLFFLAAAVLVVWWRAKNGGWRAGWLLLVLGLLLMSFLTYNAPFLICMAMLPFLPYFFWRQGKAFFLPLMAMVGLALGLMSWLLLPVITQKNGIVIFNDGTVYQQYITYRESLTAWQQKIFGQEEFFWGGIILRNIGASFGPNFWLFGGAHPWHKLPGSGLVTGMSWGLWWGGVIMVLGSGVRKLRRKSGRERWEIKVLVVLLLTLIPSVITTDAPHVTRSLEFFYVLCLLVGVMAKYLLQRWWRVGRVVIVMVTIGLLIEGGSYFASYLKVLTEQNLFQGGIEKVLQDDGRPTLIISGERPYQYIKVAWAAKMEAGWFWKTLVRENPDAAGIKGVSDLANYHFFDLGVPTWDNWLIVRYNSELRQWERVDD
jgi:4-amino-4-deoxy-L-arabinose transferase-like glycosyltransferase